MCRNLSDRGLMKTPKFSACFVFIKMQGCSIIDDSGVDVRTIYIVMSNDAHNNVRK